VTERSGEEQQRVVVNDRRRIDPDTGAVRAQSTAGAGGTPAPGAPAGPPSGAGAAQAGAPAAGAAASAQEVEVAKRELAERTADLRRRLSSGGYAVHGDLPEPSVRPGALAPDEERVLALAMRVLLGPPIGVPVAGISAPVTGEGE